MVTTRGKKSTSSSNGTVGENEAAENALTEMQASDSLIAKLEESMIDAHVEDKEQATVEDSNNDEHEQTYGKEDSGKMKEVENDDENKTATETHATNMEQSEKNTSEDDERDDQDAIWEDDDNSEDTEEYVASKDELVFGEDEVGEEEEIEEQDVYENGDEVSEEEDIEDQDVNENEDEVSEEEGMGGEDDEEVKINEEEAVEEEGNQENIQEGKEITKEVEREDKRDIKEHNTEKAKVSLKKNEKLRQRRKRKKQAQKQKVSEEKPESSSKKKAKKVKSMGMIFMCSSKTKDDCYKYRVLGLPESKKDIVVKIYSGMRLFLYDVDLKLLYGIYKAAGPGGYNIEPKAFKSQFPSQVRFTILDDCLPLAEENFKKVIKDNYFTKNKFDCKLNSEQVKKLCELFLDSSKGRKSTKSRKTRKAAKPARKGKASRQRTGDKRRRAPRDESHYNERPHKRPRPVIISPVALPPIGSSYVIARAPDVDVYRQDPYLEARSPYRDRRNPVSNHRDGYRDRRSPVSSRHDGYRDRRNPISSHHDGYTDGRYPPTERHDYYREGRSVYLERQYPHRDRLDYIDRTDPYIDVSRSSYPKHHERLYLEPRDPYRDGQELYLDGHALDRDRLYPKPYSTAYKRDPLPVCTEVFREDQGGLKFRDPHSREEPVDHRGLPSLTRPSRLVGNRDSLVAHRGHLSYPEPVYSSEYLTGLGSGRLYHL